MQQSRNIKEEPFTGCRTCLSHPTPMARHPGFYLENGYAVECECHKEWVKDQLVVRRVKHGGMRILNMNYNPITDYKGLGSTKEVSNLVHFSNNFPTTMLNTHLYLWGPHKTQKTTLGNWLGISLVKRGYSVKMVLMNSLINDLQTNYEDKKKTEEAWASYLKLDCLIIDESFDPHKVILYKSGYQFPFIDSFLRERMEDKKKSTIFISNIQPNQIGKTYTPSIESLVLRNTVDKGTALHFRDVYDEVVNTFENVSDIFKHKRGL